MAQKETNVLKRILLAVGSLPHVRLFRNHVGGGYVTQSPVPGSRYQSFGLMQGSADLIGWTEVTVTPEMVGQSVAVFTSIEVKTATGRARKNQERWATYVKKSGGLAGFARDEQEARRIISGRK